MDAHAVELTLWRLVKHDIMATARSRRGAGGLELCIFVGDELFFWSRVFAPTREHVLDAEVEIKRLEFITAGWVAVEE